MRQELMKSKTSFRSMCRLLNEDLDYYEKGYALSEINILSVRGVWSAPSRSRCNGSGSLSMILLPSSREEAVMYGEFPAVGHRYLVDFVAFRVELYFSSLTSLTYTGVAPDGSRGGSETVTIRVEPIRDNLFLVTWQEADKTTVVHVEDYAKNTIVTNITNPDNSFDQFHGTFTMLS